LNRLRQVGLLPREPVTRIPELPVTPQEPSNTAGQNGVTLPARHPDPTAAPDMVGLGHVDLSSITWDFVHYPV
jgi:hypothetical protein